MNLSLPILLTLAFATQLVGAPGRAQQDRNLTLCECHDIPLAIPKDAGEMDLSLSSHAFGSSALGDSWSWINFRNTLGSSVVAIELVIEFTDEQGHLIAQLPYDTMLDSRRVKFPLTEPSSTRELLKRPVRPGALLKLVGILDLVTNTCPTKARLVYSRILFGNGRLKEWKAPDYSTQPALSSADPIMAVPLQNGTLPIRLLANAEISKEGTIANLDPIGRTDPTLLESLRSAVQNWKFYPASRDGAPIPSQLTFLFYFDVAHSGKNAAKENWPFSASDIPKPLVIVRLFPQPQKPREWEARYGFRPAGAGVTYPPGKTPW